jgi:para-nitrobenzyl esterase
MARLSVPEDVIQRFGSPLAVLPFRPVADGDRVPADPLSAVAGGSAAGIPLVTGTNLEEWKLFALMSPPTETAEALRARLALLTDDPDGALAAYRAEHPEAPPSALEQAVLTDYVFRIPACALADAQAAHAPVWQYRFDWRSPALGGLLGAAHAVEIPFVFDMVEDHRLHVLVGAEAPAGLARAMHTAWVATATDGDPSATGLAWPGVDGPDRPVLCLDDEPQVRPDPEATTRRFWLGG